MKRQKFTSPTEGREKAYKPASLHFFADQMRDVSENEIYPNLSLKDCGLFAQTSQTAEEAVAFLRLLSSAVDAEPESYQQEDATKLAAIAILKRHPELLFRKGVVTDHYGRKIGASPYQLFLGAGDAWALKQIHAEIIPHINDGEAQAEIQFKSQFPGCPWPFDPNAGEEQLYDDRNKKQLETVIAQLKVIVRAITSDPCTDGFATLDETRKAVTELGQIFEPKEGEIITTGLHFPSAIMGEVGKVCQIQHSPWSGAQLAFFSREVLGAVEAALTAVDGQCCKYGLSRLDMKNGPDRRDGLFCRHPKGVPEELAPIHDKLGYDMFVDPDDGSSCFVASDPRTFNWYNQTGLTWGVGGCLQQGLLGSLWGSKANMMGEVMCDTEVNTLSR